MEQGKRMRKNDPEFKQEVLRLVAEGRSAIEVAQDLEITPDIIYAWRRKEKRLIGAVAFAAPGKKTLTREEDFKALREELAATKRERDILKKHWPSSRKNLRITEIRDSAGYWGNCPG